MRTTELEAFTSERETQTERQEGEKDGKREREGQRTLRVEAVVFIFEEFVTQLMPEKNTATSEINACQIIEGKLS